MRRELQSGVLLAVLALTGASISGCGAEPYRPADEQQVGSCDGVARPAELSLIPPDAVITDVAICVGPVEQYVGGQGLYTFDTVRTLPAAKIPELMAGLTLPDASGTAEVCSMVLIRGTPAFTVTLADGSRIRPGVPGDGCHLRGEATKAFSDLSSMPVRSKVRGKQVSTEFEIATGCESSGKSVAIQIDAQDGTRARLPGLPSGAISVCRYRNGQDQEGPLVAAGLPGRAAVVATWPVASALSTPTCARPADVMTGPAVDWVTVRQAAIKPYRFDGTGSRLLAFVELGGCRRLVTSRGGVAGSLDQATVEALAALADTPVG